MKWENNVELVNEEIEGKWGYKRYKRVKMRIRFTERKE